MKLRIIRLILTAAVLLMAAGCVGLNFSPMNVGGGGPTVRGEGPMISAEYAVEAYDGVDVGGWMKIVYSADASDSVVIEAQENLHEYFSVTVEYGILRVRQTRSMAIAQEHIPILYISTPDLRIVDVSGTSEIICNDTISGAEFTLNVSGAGSGTVVLDVDKLDVSISGAGDMKLSGRADDTGLMLSGAGSIGALELDTKNANIHLTGAASASISCSDELSVSISGAGSLRYYGSPNIRQQVSGAGSVRQVDRRE